MKKEHILIKIAEFGRKAAIKANGDASLYLLFQPKEPEILGANKSSEDVVTEKK
jgi:hypothetical protein